MNGFSFLLVSALITGFCVLLCIVYISNKVKEARCAGRLLDADFPFDTRRLNKKTVEKYADIYSRSSSDVRLAMGMFYTKDKFETIRTKAEPSDFPKRKV